MQRSPLYLLVVCVVFSSWSVLPARAHAPSDAATGADALTIGDLDTALQLLNRALFSSGLSEEQAAITFHHRAIAHQRRGDLSRAIIDYTQALQREALPPALRPRALNNRAICLEQIGDLEFALVDLNAALRLMPDYPDAFANRGSVLRKMRQNELAVKDYRAAMGLNYQRPLLALQGIGLALEDLGRVTEAAGHYRQALVLDPKFRPAQERLAALKAGPVLSFVAERSSPGATAIQTPVARAIVAGDPKESAEPVLRAAILDRAAEPITGAGFAANDLPPVPNKKTREIIVVQDTRLAFGPKGGPESGAAPNLLDNPGQPISASSALEPLGGGSNVLVPTPSWTGRVARTGRPVQVAEQTARAVPASGNVFALQLGSYQSRALAEAGWQAILAQRAQELTALSPHIVTAAVPRKGEVFRLQAQGFADRGEAQKVCGRLRKTGQACFIVQIAGTL